MAARRCFAISHDLAMAAVTIGDISKLRLRPSFANGRDIQTMLDNAQTKWLERGGAVDERGNLIFVENDLFKPPSVMGSAAAVLGNMVNMEHIIRHIEKLEVDIRVEKVSHG